MESWASDASRGSGWSRPRCCGRQCLCLCVFFFFFLQTRRSELLLASVSRMKENCQEAQGERREEVISVLPLWQRSVGSDMCVCSGPGGREGGRRAVASISPKLPRVNGKEVKERIESPTPNCPRSLEMMSPVWFSCWAGCRRRGPEWLYCLGSLYLLKTNCSS